MLVAGAVGAAAVAAEPLLNHVCDGVVPLMRHAWDVAGRLDDQNEFARAMQRAWADGEAVVRSVGWLLLVVFAAAAVARLAQIGPRWSLSRSSALAQLGMSGRERAAGSLARAVIGVGIGTVCVVWVLWESRGGLVMLVETSGTQSAVQIIGGALRTILWWVAGGLVLFGLVDLVAVRASLRAKLWMTRDELMREEREQQAPARRGEVERDLGRQAALVPGAAVVLRSGTAAAALAYQGGEDEVPMVIATAFRAGAGAMCDLAVVSGVVVLDAEAELVMELARLGPGALVPVAWYERVGELLEVVRQQLEAAGREVPWGK